ncbi:hypothetical protein [Halostella salina]|nr:hypothetical protein [Halostella salina]
MFPLIAGGTEIGFLLVLFLVIIPAGLWLFNHILRGYNEGRGYADDEE